MCRDSAYELHGDNLSAMLVACSPFMLSVLSVDRLIRELEVNFGGSEELLKFLKENDLDKLKKTIFDFDWREDAEEKKMICCLSLDTSGSEFFPFELTATSRTNPEYQGLRTKLLKIFQIFSTYTLAGITLQDLDGIGVLLFFANLRSSCMSNISIMDLHNKVYGYAMFAVKAGQELLISKL
jgi:hypothetical protein